MHKECGKEAASLLEQRGAEYVKKWWSASLDGIESMAIKVYGWECIQHATAIRAVAQNTVGQATEAQSVSEVESSNDFRPAPAVPVAYRKQDSLGSFHYHDYAGVPPSVLGVGWHPLYEQQTMDDLRAVIERLRAELDAERKGKT